MECRTRRSPPDSSLHRQSTTFDNFPATPILEDTYRELRSRIELEIGSLPSARRILKAWGRRGSMDCVTEVGERDPLRGGTPDRDF